MAIRINLGCGHNHVEGFTNIDNRPEVYPDLVCDVLNGLPYDENSVEYIRAFDFLEHVPIGKVISVIEDIYRVLKPGGTFESLTPSTDGRGAFQDPFHVSFWNRNSWIYYMVDFYRELYGIKAKFSGNVTDHITSDELKIIHTHAMLEAVKP